MSGALGDRQLLDNCTRRRERPARALPGNTPTTQVLVYRLSSGQFEQEEDEQGEKEEAEKDAASYPES